MKILFFSPYFHPYTSGIAVHAKMIAAELSKVHDVTILTFPHQTGLPAKEKIDDITVLRMPYAARVSKGFISPQSLRFFWSWGRNSDAVILNLPNAEGALLAVIASLLRKRRVAIFNCFVDLGRGLWPRLLSFVVNNATLLQCALAHEVIGFPDYVEHTILMKLFSKKITPLQPPVSEKPVDRTFLKKLVAQKKKKKWVGFVGRVAREKGLEYLVEAVSAMRRKNIELILVGPAAAVGEEEYAQKIKNMLRGAHIPHRFPGYLEDAQLGAMYKALDVLVLPSINRTEAFGLVQIEAILAGTPVVASNLPGVRYAVQKTGMGSIVPPGNSQLLASSILKVLKEKRTFTTPARLKAARDFFKSSSDPSFYHKIISKPAF